MAIVVQIVLEFESWTVVELTCVCIKCKVCLISCFHGVVEVATAMSKHNF
jgi:hypothetical protein